MQNYLLRYYLAEAGLDPDRDVQIRAVPPPAMVAKLRAEEIDGFLGPDPFNQRAVYDGVGFIHLLTRELWDGHPCCAFAVPRKMVTETPNTYQALLKSVIQATEYANMADNREDIAASIAGPEYLNQPEAVLEQVLTGKFPDGLGGTKRVPDRIRFDPFPYPSMALWIMTQMKRWGPVKGDLQWRDVAQQVFLAAGAEAKMKGLGIPTPADPLPVVPDHGQDVRPQGPGGLYRLLSDPAHLMPLQRRSCLAAIWEWFVFPGHDGAPGLIEPVIRWQTGGFARAGITAAHPFSRLAQACSACHPCANLRRFA